MQNPIQFSKRSRRAILIFTGILLVLVLIPRAYFLMNPPEKFTFSQTDFEKHKFKNYVFQEKKRKVYPTKKSKFSIPQAKFDPNTYAASDWMMLGMSQKQAEIIVKFGKRGFYAPEDLKRVFVVSDQFYALIKDSLVFPPRPAYTNFEKSNPVIKSVRKIEINLATEEELMTIKGIGAFFAKNIVKKRNELGGFRSKDQLLEIWKFDQEKLDGISEFITVDPTLIRQINLNTATAEELKRHPYIYSWNIANSIVKIRTQLGGFQRIDDIKKSVLITDEIFEKVKPYLTL